MLVHTYSHGPNETSQNSDQNNKFFRRSQQQGDFLSDFYKFNMNMITKVYIKIHSAVHE